MKLIRRQAIFEKCEYNLVVTYLEDDGTTSVASFDIRNHEELRAYVDAFVVKRAVYMAQIFPGEAPISGAAQRNLTKRIRSHFSRNGEVTEF